MTTKNKVKKLIKNTRDKKPVKKSSKDFKKDDFMSFSAKFKVKNPTPADNIRDFVEYADKK